MDRLIATNSVPLAGADVAPGAGAPQYATDGNPALNIPATRWPAYQYNAIQEELLNIIASAGIAPDRTNNAQVLKAIRALTITRLLAATNVYVRADGNDANDGSANDAAHAWLTVQHAIDVVRGQYFLGGNTLNINIGAGNFAGPSIRGIIPGQRGAGVYAANDPPIQLIGQGAGVTILTDTVVSDLAAVGFQNMSMRGTSRSLQIFAGAEAAINNIAFDGTPGSFHMELYAQGRLQARGNFGIGGSCQAWLSCGVNSVAIILGKTITFTGTPSFANAGVFLQGNGYVNIGSSTCVGGANGAKYSSTYNSVLELGGTVLAGSSSGITLNGGQVIP